MKVSVNKIIASEVKRINALFTKGSKELEKDFKPFTIEDYTYAKESHEYFGDFSLPHFITYSVFKNIEARILKPYPGKIWYWKKGLDKSKSESFLNNQTKLMHDTLNAYMALLKSEHHLQALILFRSYIEYSSQYYAALLDYEFFQKYLGSDVTEEYKKLWFSTLKPAKVLSRIKSIHSEVDVLLKEEKIEYADFALYSMMFRPFDSHLRGTLYESLSSLAHGSYTALLKNNETRLYALVWLCSAYLIESHIVIEELTSIYFNRSIKELLNEWVSVEIYLNSRKNPTAELFFTP